MEEYLASLVEVSAPSNNSTLDIQLTSVLAMVASKDKSPTLSDASNRYLHEPTFSPLRKNNPYHLLRDFGSRVLNMLSITEILSHTAHRSSLKHFRMKHESRSHFVLHYRSARHNLTRTNLRGHEVVQPGPGLAKGRAQSVHLSLHDLQRNEPVILSFSADFLRKFYHLECTLNTIQWMRWSIRVPARALNIKLYIQSITLHQEPSLVPETQREAFEHARFG